MIQKPLAGRLIAAARRFESMAPWQEISDQEPIAFELPDEAHPIYTLTLGNAGRAFGLGLYFGERALEQIRILAAEDRPPVVATMIILEFEPPGASPQEGREVARVAGVSGRIIPTFVAIDPSRRARIPTNRELRLCLQVLDAYAKADAAELLRPRRLEPHRASKMLTLRVEGSGKTLDVTARFVEVPAWRPAAPALASLPWPLPELPIEEEHWAIGVEPAPFDVAEAQARPELLVAIDVASDQLLAMQIVAPKDDPLDLEPAMEAFALACTEPKVGAPRLPRQITFAHRRLGEALAPGLAHLGIAVDHDAEHALVRQVFAEFASRTRTGEADLDRIPEPTDAAGWEAVHLRLQDRIGYELDGVDVDARRPVLEFFGDTATVEALEDAPMPQQAYEQWYFVGYRPARNRRTLAERLLDADLPPPERLLLQAHVQARAGIYRVSEVRPPLFVLSDVLSDHQAEIIDGHAAAQLQVEQVLPFRIGEAAGHRFVIPVGPPLNRFDLDAAVAFLEHRFGSCTSEDLQQKPQRLGALWGWVLQRAKGPGPRMQNTDGDPLRLQVATFEVADWNLLQRALAARADVEGDDDGESWTWVRRDGGPGGAGGNTILGELERVADELLVHVNSEARLAAVRDWVEAVGGVTFVRAREEAMPDDVLGAGGRRSLAAREIEPSGEELAHFQEMFENRCMQWLDEEIPALGGRTPREAVRDAEGRKAVLRLIRSWGDPAGMKGLRVPRDRMREELGLGLEGEAESGG